MPRTRAQSAQSAASSRSRASTHAPGLTSLRSRAITFSSDVSGPRLVSSALTARSSFLQLEVLGLGRFATWANLTSTLMGGGLLEMAFAYKQSGFSAGIVTVILSALSAWTFVLIGKCCDKADELLPEEQRDGEPLDWPILGQAAFGRPGKLLVGALFVGDLMMCMLTFQLLCGSSLQIIFPSIDKTYLICASGLFTMLMSLVPHKYLGAASSAGIVATIVFITSMAVSGAAVNPEPDILSQDVWTLHNLPTAVSIVMFGLVAHAEAPTIYNPLDKKESFPTICAAAFGVGCLFYLAVGCIGYIFYGDDVQPNFLNNIGLDLDGRMADNLVWLRKLAAALFAAKLQVVVPIFMEPMTSVMEVAYMQFCIRDLRDANAEEEEEDVKEDKQDDKHKFLHVGTRAFCTVILVILAFLLDGKLEHVTGLTGSLFSLSVALTFPILLYTKLNWTSFTLIQKISMLAIGLACFALQAWSVANAVLQMVQ